MFGDARRNRRPKATNRTRSTGPTTRRIYGALLFSALVLSCGGSTSDYLLRADKLRAAGNLSEAELLYRKAIQREPTLAAAYNGLALLQLDQPGKQPEAIESFRRALQLDPGNVRVKRTLAELDLTAYLALPSRPLRLYEEATKLIGELLAADPKDFDGLRLRGTLAVAERKPAEAITYFRQAHAVSPAGNYDATLGLARSLLENGEFNEGERVTRGILEHNKTFEAAYDLLYAAYVQSNQSGKAEAILHEKVIGTNKVSAHIQLAAHLRRSGNLAASEAEIAGIPSGTPDADLHIGDFYVGVQEWDKALRRFEAGAGPSRSRHRRSGRDQLRVQHPGPRG